MISNLPNTKPWYRFTKALVNTTRKLTHTFKLRVTINSLHLMQQKLFPQLLCSYWIECYIKRFRVGLIKVQHNCVTLCLCISANVNWYPILYLYYLFLWSVFDVCWWGCTSGHHRLTPRPHPRREHHQSSPGTRPKWTK